MICPWCKKETERLIPVGVEHRLLPKEICHECDDRIRLLIAGYLKVQDKITLRIIRSKTEDLIARCEAHHIRRNSSLLMDIEE